jgi:hypothetical protein
MKESAKNRTDYQEFLYSLFIKYGIDSPDESWSNSEWKIIVDNKINNYDREDFYKELSAFNIKTPSDENWTHASDKTPQEIKAEKEKHIAIDAKKVEEESALLIKELEKEKEEEERIADAKKVEEEKSILYALKVEEDKVPKKEEFHTENIKYGESKKCPYCAEDINIAAIKCKHCGEIFDKEKISRNTYDVASAVLRNQGTPKDQRHTRTVVVRENNNGCLTFLVLLILIFIVLYFFVGPLIFWGKLISFTQSL